MNKKHNYNIHSICSYSRILKCRNDKLEYQRYKIKVDNILTKMFGLKSDKLSIDLKQYYKDNKDCVDVIIEVQKIML